MNTSKYIDLDKRFNVSLIVGVIISVIVLTIFATSKMWLPDDRSVMEKNNNTKLFFMMSELETKKFYRNVDDNIGEIHLTVSRNNDKKEYELSYEIENENGIKLPNSLITGNKELLNVDSEKSKQDVILQFGMPKDIYYVKIIISQKDNTSQEVILDYRNFKKKDISEKGKNYLVNIENENKKLSSLKQQEKKYGDVIRNTEKEIAALKESDDVEKDKKIIEKQKIIDDIKEKEEYKELKKQIDLQSEKVKGMKGVI